MALLQLIFGGPKKAQIGVMQLDASITEEHTREAAISQNAIEDGSNIADHVNLSPRRVRIQGVISDAPIDFLGSALGTATGLATSAVQSAFGGGGSLLGSIAGQAASLGVGSLAGLVANRPRSTEDSFNYLEELWIKREPFTIITALTRYDNMIAQNLSVPRNARVGKGLQFTVTAEEVTIVKSALIKVAQFQVDNPSGADRGNLGKQAAKAAKDATGNKTIALTLLQKGSAAAGVPVFQ